MLRLCDTCNTPYDCRPYRMNKPGYCSRECHNVARYEKARRLLVCEYCGEEFIRLQSELKRNPGKFCSVQCGAWARKKVFNYDHDYEWLVHTQGYIYAKAHGHPLSIGRGVVFQHWHNFWVEHDCADWVIEAKDNGASIHHKNGNRADNDITNLELRLSGDHPRGVSVQDAIDMLENMGYEIITPEEQYAH